jgi:hypothetical protein
VTHYVGAYTDSGQRCSVSSHLSIEARDKMIALFLERSYRVRTATRKLALPMAIASLQSE